ncbi:hypothetical protein B0H66DRAFT_201331 [Apodospora peruviana]|uniref:LysM domain-containing protein n=1 Tax=Apodospora peruviana TaxID=516989 RepID=A0AAE0ICH1_9PEZI|nr:hypothetical protein B0H66DRAFT_201331 [Apodospora peruviana]
MVTMRIGQDQQACCTCATLLSQVPRYHPSESSTSEKPIPLPDNRKLECCTRVICGNCIINNARFGSYCPYCQTSSPSSSSSSLSAVIPLNRLKEPPSYYHRTPPPDDTLPPPYWNNDDTNKYTSSEKQQQQQQAQDSSEESENGGHQQQDILHFLNHDHDTVTSLSLRYNVPIPVLRQANRLTSDHLLLGRRTVLIPSVRGGISLSPRPVEGEEEEARKAKIRRWMVACKVADYDVAVLYLEQAGYDLDLATEAYFADEAWELDHPMLLDHGTSANNDGRKGKAAAAAAATTAGTRYQRLRLLRDGGGGSRSRNRS